MIYKNLNSLGLFFEHFSLEILKQFELIGHFIFNLKNFTINQPLEIVYMCRTLLYKKLILAKINCKFDEAKRIPLMNEIWLKTFYSNE